MGHRPPACWTMHARRHTCCLGSKKYTMSAPRGDCACSRVPGAGRSAPGAAVQLLPSRGPGTSSGPASTRAWVPSLACQLPGIPPGMPARPLHAHSPAAMPACGMSANACGCQRAVHWLAQHAVAWQAPCIVPWHADELQPMRTCAHVTCLTAWWVRACGRRQWQSSHACLLAVHSDGGEQQRGEEP